MKLSHWLAALAVSTMIAPAAMAKSAPRPRGAQMRVHSIKKVAGKVSKRKGKGAKATKTAQKGQKPRRTRRHSAAKRVQLQPPQA